MEELTIIQKISVWTLPVLFAITLHEVAHGWAALKCGDKTAQKMGRLSLNPLHHIDPVGTLILPCIMLALGGFIFGWAKPVPVDFGKLRNPRRDMVIVALAGPLANLGMAIAWAILGRIASGMDSEFIARPLAYMAEGGIIINAVLMVLNLLPLPPLDGGRIVTGLLPLREADKFARIEPYGFFILLGLMATGLLNVLLGPPIGMLLNLLSVIAGQ